MLKAGLESEKIVRNTLIIDILGQYYQVLYARGLENASKLQLELSEKQHFRILKMVETGKEALSKHTRWRVRYRLISLHLQLHIILPARLLQQ